MNLPNIAPGVWPWIWVVVLLALVLVIVVARSRDYAEQRVRQATRQLEALNEFHRVVMSDLDLHAILSRITWAVTHNLGFHSAAVYLFNANNMALEGEVAHSQTSERTVSSVSLPIAAGGILTDALFADTVGIHKDNTFAVPIFGATPLGAVPHCWLAPESRCTQTPKATMQNRVSVCVSCHNFAVVGVLEANHDQAKQGDESKASQLPDYAQASAVAVRSATLYSQAENESAQANRRLQQLELIGNVGGELSRSLELERILELMARGLAQLGYSRVSVALVDDQHVRGYMTFVHGNLHWTGELSRIYFPIATHNDPFARVAKSGQAMVIPDASYDASLPMNVRAEGRTIGYVPITAPRGRGASGWVAGDVVVLGVLAVDQDNLEREINQTDLDVIGILAAQVGVAIENANEFASLVRREREARALAHVNQALAARILEEPKNLNNNNLVADNKTLSDQSWLDQLCNAVAAYAVADAVVVLRGNGAVAGANREVRRDGLQLGDLRLLTIDLRAAITVPPHDARIKELMFQFPNRHWALLPLQAAGRRAGTLVLARNANFTHEFINKLEGIAQQLGLALENVELYKRLDVERSRLAAAIEHMTDGVILIDEAGVADSAGFLENAQANAVARRLLHLPERFDPVILPTQLRVNLESGNTSLKFGESRLEVATARVANLRVITVQDVARFRAIERTKAELLSVVSHELRTPLTAIIGFVELLLSGAAGPLTEDQNQFLQTTLDASKNLHQTVLNLLNASMLEAGLFELNPRMAKLEFTNALNHFERQALDKNIVFLRDVVKIPRVFVDSSRLELVLWNLLSNAMRYTASGGEVEVQGRIESGELRLTVRDTGAGMSKQQLSNLFSRFSRGNDSREALEGAGLSLYVSKAIVAAHGGRIWATSTLGEGSVFHLALPLAPNFDLVEAHSRVDD